MLLHCDIFFIFFSLSASVNEGDMPESRLCTSSENSVLEVSSLQCLQTTDSLISQRAIFFQHVESHLLLSFSLIVFFAGYFIAASSRIHSFENLFIVIFTTGHHHTNARAPRRFSSSLFFHGCRFAAILAEHAESAGIMSDAFAEYFFPTMKPERLRFSMAEFHAATDTPVDIFLQWSLSSSSSENCRYRVLLENDVILAACRAAMRHRPSAPPLMIRPHIRRRRR
jgi:hypothetical protein